MIANPILTLAWLALAHLVADFVIQSNRVATDKFGDGMPAWRALALHVAGVAVCLLPFVVAFGLAGLWLLVVVSASHGVIDRLKVLLTRRAEARALAEARAMHEGPAPEASLGTAWTAVPAGLFVLDQVIHAVVLLAAWAAFLVKAPVVDPFASAVNGVIGASDPATVQRVTLIAVVLLDLAIINIRAGSLFVAILVHPREEITGADEAAAVVEPATTVAAAAGASAPESGLQVDAAGSTASAASTVPAGSAGSAGFAGFAGSGALVVPARRSVASPARVGATIGVLERLLIVALILTNATAAVGLVIAAKTIARFKQLDDRMFAEYYLLGTLASVSVAVGSAVIAAAALAAP